MEAGHTHIACAEEQCSTTSKVYYPVLIGYILTADLMYNILLDHR